MPPVVYVVSDLHLSSGIDAASGRWDPLEDFFADEAFAAFLDTISQRHRQIELVINGDFIDHTQVLPELGLSSPDHRLGSTEDESLERTRVVLGLRPELASGHPAFFARLRRFMEDGHSITVIAGNHDIDLLWPEVWGLLFDAIYPPGAAGQLRRVPFSYTIGSGRRVYIEHGHERDPANCFGDEMRVPFGEDQYGIKRLKRCWGTLFVDTVYNWLERERWFIDNVKPIIKAVLLGLRTDLAFTAGALARIAKFLLTAGMPPRTLSAVLGDAEPTVVLGADAVVDTLADPALKQHLAARLADPAFRAEFEQALQGFSSEDWHDIAAGMPHQPTLNDLAPTPESAVLGESDDEYRAAARALLEADPTLGVVIMGHTHGAIDGLTNPIDLADGRTGYYFNSGTWTTHLRQVAGVEPTWEALAQRESYTSSLTYLRLVPDDQGEYRVELDNWAREWDAPIPSQADG